MGQYQQWLLLREIDQSLKAQLETLEQELDQLYKQADLLAKTTSYTDNKILQMLAKQQAIEDAQHISPEYTIPTRPPRKSALSGVSHALFAWSSLPNFDSQGLPTPSSPAETSSTIPNPELHLLPEDMSTFVDEHAPQTVPQVKLPWWLRKTVSTTTSKHRAIYLQSLRANYDVQRWLERWGRDSKDPQMAREDQVK